MESLLAERSTIVGYESIQLWCNKFSLRYARRLRHRHRSFGDTFYRDEVFVKIRGIQYSLWRAVEKDGEIVDVFLQCRRNRTLAKEFFKQLLKAHHQSPRKIVTNKLKGYGVAHRELISETIHGTWQYSNNRTELSHQPKRAREQRVRRFKSIDHAQRFVNIHAAMHNSFNLDQHPVSANNYRMFRPQAFASWNCAVE